MPLGYRHSHKPIPVGATSCTLLHAQDVKHVIYLTILWLSPVRFGLDGNLHRNISG